jgi:hypothetical protein
VRAHLRGTSAAPFVVAACCSLLSITSSSAAAPQGGAKAVDGEGCIRETSAGECKAAAAGAAIAPQATFIAGKGGATLLFTDKTSVRLTEGTEVRVLPRTKVQLSAREETPASVVQMARGKLVATLAGGAVRSAFMIKAPHAITTIVKHGSALVKLLDDGVAVGALEGTSLVAAGNDWSDVAEGKLRIIRKGDPKGTSRALVSAPELLPHSGMQLMVGPGKGQPVKLAWKPVVSAEAYEVELQPAGRPAVSRKVTKDQTELAFPDLAPGAYVAAVRAVDAEELESAWSPRAKFSLVGMELPRGALMMANGAIQLPDGQKVKLKNVDGLETSINDMTTFLPPPSEIGLLAGKAQVLRIRRKGEAEELRVKLEPRNVKALVDLTPRTARWPEDPVQISIRLATPDGHAPVGDVDLVPRVTIDLEQISVDWARQGGVMRGTVAPRGDNKPHIVRVEVSDQYGFYLGRNFLEVAPSHPAARR